MKHGHAYIHSASVGSNGEIVVAGSGCWQIHLVTLNIAGKTHNGRSYGIGWAMKVDDEANSEWIRGIGEHTN